MLNADGSYIYTLNNTLPAVQALQSGQSLDDTFAYTLRDADGTSSTATLAVHIDGRNELAVQALDAGQSRHRPARLTALADADGSNSTATLVGPDRRHGGR